MRVLGGWLGGCRVGQDIEEVWRSAQALTAPLLEVAPAPADDSLRSLYEPPKPVSALARPPAHVRCSPRQLGFSGRRGGGAGRAGRHRS